MRPKLIALAGCIVSVALALALNALIPAPAHSIVVSNPNPNIIEGEPTCSGPPGSSNYLQFNGTQWCDAAVAAPTYPNTFIYGYLSTTSGVGANTLINGISTLGAGHLIRLIANAGVGPTTCTTTPQFCVINNSACVAGSTVTISAGGTADSGAISVALVNSTATGIYLSRQAAGCATFPQGINLMAAMSTP